MGSNKQRTAAPAPLQYCPSCRRHFENRTHAFCPTDGSPLLETPRELPRPGHLLDHRILLGEVLATGGMGVVFRAFDLNERRDLAVKVLRPEFSADVGVVRQFYREARASRRLSHPHIVRVHEFGRSADGQLYLAMELLTGFSLADVLADRYRLRVATTLHLGRQICAALEYAHRHGTVHRDLKPENIQLVPTEAGPDHVKMLDFGIARVLAFDREGDSEGGRLIAGTPVYMSPEQIRGIPADPRSDLYALGVLLYEMLVGGPPFSDDDPVETCRRHLREEVRPFAGRVAERLPDGLERLVLQLLAKNPARRPANAAAVGRLLEGLAQADHVGAPAACVPAADEDPTRALPTLNFAGLPEAGGARPAVAPGPSARDDQATLIETDGNPFLRAERPQAQLTALWLCEACGHLHAALVGRCSHCGARLRQPLVGVPAVAPQRAERETPAWHPQTHGRVAAGVRPRELALLHAVFGGTAGDGRWRPGHVVRQRLEEPLARWLLACRAVGGRALASDDPGVLQVVFGLDEPRSPDWLTQAADEAAALVAAVNAAGSRAGEDLRVRVGLAGGAVYWPEAGAPDLAGLLHGSRVELAIRLARTCPPGQVLLNEWCGRRLEKSFHNRTFDAIRVREKATSETLYTLGPAISARVGTARPATRPAGPEPAVLAM